MEKRQPNLIIAGTAKAGTTSLFTYLARHPDIGACRVKESCYFLPIRYGGRLAPFEEYLQLFSGCRSEKYVLEATPGYFEGGSDLASEIRCRLGANVRILISLRSPVARLLSFFRYKKGVLELPSDLRLEDYLDRCLAMPFSERARQENDVYWGVDGGFYARYLTDWLEIFGPERVHIIFFEDLAQQPEQVMFELAQWLCLDPKPFSRMRYSVENRSTLSIHAGLHRHAMTVNRSLEPILRKMPLVKSVVRSVYYAVNGTKREARENVSADTLKRIESIYHESNSNLAQTLIRARYQKFPSWLAGYVNNERM